ncbi:Uu.00g102250.m01.CDS01 [Anthostomella pinea]|uniref:Uu.00g102250.m01.CDS01 n=1 Tax=Anthostomella pinea TaxID=933095 RepID=A0AAI8YFH3_9PEZI|nr:Uu.00g102250.m01.CDS01 [Anthostomella pinea]
MEDFKLFTSLRYDPALIEAPSQGYVTTRWNQTPSPFYMLDFHRDRMLRAADHWGWTAASQTLAGEEGLSRLETLLHEKTAPLGKGPHRVKILLAQDGCFSVEVHPTPSVPLRNLLPACLPEPAGEGTAQAERDKVPVRDFKFNVFVDKQGTPSSEFTHFKTTHRIMYDEARSRYGLSLADPKEVLLVNSEDGSIMEGSISTPYFWRNGRWVTPPVSRGFSATHCSGGNDGTTRRWALERYRIFSQH